jgi:hypothetical protein
VSRWFSRPPARLADRPPWRVRDKHQARFLAKHKPPHTMKQHRQTIPGWAFAAISLLAAADLPAAFIIATNGSLGAGNYAYTGPGGTAASTGTASAGNLPATTDVPPTFFTLAHIYGGNGTTDEYTFTYSPALDSDNTTFGANTVFNLPQNLRSTGLDGGTGGFYNVYRLHPANPGVSGGNTTYRVFVNGGLEITEVINQNLADLGTGQNIGRWERIGSVAVPNASDILSVKMTPDSSTFVSMRASGIMFEYTGPIPEPAAGALLGLGVWVFLRRRR